MYKLLLDTNVLVDYYLGREPGCSACARILELASGTHAIYVAAVSLKDLYYIVGATLKRANRQEQGVLLHADAEACNQIAWSCVRQAMEFVIVASTGKSECLDAFVCRAVHDDFEDNLILATARSMHADFLVTGDEKLALHSPVGALSAQSMARLLEAEAAG